ncbi:tyrosine recombinase [Elysia marginata]|uniref:Tyrosine recombinase n=1 Tax=Elysia marginata TaxID=1093978 RepID=A0AAV4G9W6_9GAST|nr:tyrosine recombinase [Elysia marginata]
MEGKCFLDPMKFRVLCLSSFQFNWPSSQENRAGPGAGNPDSTMLAHTSVVFKASVAAIPTTSNPAQVSPSPSSSHLQRATPPREEVETDCLAIVRRALNNKSIPKGAQDISFNSWRDSTKSIDSTYIRQWIQSSHRRGGDPFREDMTLILEFLTDLHKQDKSYSTIDTVKSAIFTIMFFDLESTPSNQNIIRKFMRGLYQSNPPKSRYSTIWDANLVLQYLQRMGPSISLTVKDLSKMCAMLPGLLSVQRVQTLHVLKLLDIQLFQDQLIINISGLIKQSASSRHNPTLEFPTFHSDENLW